MLESILLGKHRVQMRSLTDGRLSVYQVLSFEIALDAQALAKLPFDSPIFANTVHRVINSQLFSVLVSWKPDSQSLLVTCELAILLSSPRLETGHSIISLVDAVKKGLVQELESGAAQFSLALLEGEESSNISR